MTTSTLLSPKSILLKIADIFQNREGVAPSNKYQERSTNSGKTSHLRVNSPAKPKLNVSLDDLKVISTALLYYRRKLAKMGEIDRADGVGVIDKKFYEIISHLEEQLEETEEVIQSAA